MNTETVSVPVADLDQWSGRLRVVAAALNDLGYSGLEYQCWQLVEEIETVVAASIREISPHPIVEE
jgi:hypothetical protein